MESATILMPPSTGLSGNSAFRQNPLFLKDQNMKKYQHYIDARGEGLRYQLHTETTRAVATSYLFHS